MGPSNDLLGENYSLGGKEGGSMDIRRCVAAGTQVLSVPPPAAGTGVSRVGSTAVPAGATGDPAGTVDIPLIQTDDLRIADEEVRRPCPPGGDPCCRGPGSPPP